MTLSTAADYIKQLANYRYPVNAREAESWTTITKAAEKRFVMPNNHVTASAIVVGSRGLILLKHKKLGIWVQPGGHIDSGETIAEAALREAQEETGLDLDHPIAGPRLGHIDVHKGCKGGKHYDMRFIIIARDDRDPSPKGEESQDVAWFNIPNALNTADESLSGLIRAIPEMGTVDIREAAIRLGAPIS